MILGGPIELSSDQQALFVAMLAGALLIGLLASVITLVMALGLRRGAAVDGGSALFGGFATGAVLAVGARLALGAPRPRNGLGWQDPSELAP